MNDIKLKTISYIKNSSLDEKDKEVFSKFIGVISEKDASRVLFAIRKNLKAISNVWEIIKTKLELMGNIDNFEFLSLEQKKVLQKEISKLNPEALEKIKEQKNKGKITTEEMKELDKKNSAIYQEMRDNLNGVLDNTKNTVSEFLAEKRKRGEENALEEVRNKVDSL